CVAPDQFPLRIAKLKLAEEMAQRGRAHDELGHLRAARLRDTPDLARDLDMLRVGLARIDQCERAVDAFAHQWRKPLKTLTVEITHRVDKLARDGRDRRAQP